MFLLLNSNGTKRLEVLLTIMYYGIDVVYVSFNIILLMFFIVYRGFFQGKTILRRVLKWLFGK